MIPVERGAHDFAEGWFDVHFIVAIPLQDYQLFGFTSPGIQMGRLFRRHKTVVVRSDKKDRTRRNLVHHPFWIETQCIVDVFQGNGIHGRRVLAPGRRREFG